MLRDTGPERCRQNFDYSHDIWIFAALRRQMKVFGLDIERHWRKIRSHIGVCQQENSLDQELSVLQNLESLRPFFGMDRGIGRQRAMELLEFFALEQRRESPVVELSGGMMRRLVLARSLINRPDILILDERYDRAGPAKPTPDLGTPR